jgi:polyhydroxyalkanoate synthesis regulator phasin
LRDLLKKIEKGLEGSSSSGRASRVWTALTMRGLDSITANSPPAEKSDREEATQSLNRSGRVEGVVNNVVAVLMPLISASQSDNLNADLLKLAESAIDIWNKAQSGEMEIVVSRELGVAQRKQWRSQKFDTYSPDEDNLVPNSSSQVFTLFPRIVARGVAAQLHTAANPPGSWPSETDHAVRVVETSIHFGIGLPEWSALVQRGKVIQEENKEILSKALESAKKQIHSPKRLSGRGGRDSRGSSMSGPISPSLQWKAGGSAMAVAER